MSDPPSPPAGPPAPPPAPPAAPPAVPPGAPPPAVGVDLPLTERTVVRLAGGERGRELLAAEDDYTRGLSPFDRTAKLQRREPGSHADYLAHARAQVLDWSADEARALRHNVELVREALLRLELYPPLPPLVEVVRSTLAEEGWMAAYTRRHFIVLGTPALGARTFAHELFHVLSRHAPAVRERLFALLGYRAVAPIAPPDDLAPHLVTNPDVRGLDAVTRVGFEGALAWAAPLLVAERAYEEGPLLDYAVARHLVVEETASGFVARREPDGRAVVLAPAEIAGLADRLGGNTPYDIHPEEVCAEHFMLLLAGERRLPRPDLLVAMRDVLRRAPAEVTPWPT